MTHSEYAYWEINTYIYHSVKKKKKHLLLLLVVMGVGEEIVLDAFTLGAPFLGVFGIFALSLGVLNSPVPWIGNGV